MSDLSSQPTSDSARGIESEWWWPQILAEMVWATPPYCYVDEQITQFLDGLADAEVDE